MGLISRVSSRTYRIIMSSSEDAPDEEKFWVKSILSHKPKNFRINKYFSKDEKLEYEIDWGGIDPETGRAYLPSYEPAWSIDQQVPDMVKAYWAKIFPDRSDEIY